jgi:hypothetical protein
MNKKRRNEITYLKYKKRIKKFVAGCRTYVDKNGKCIYNPKAIDIIKDRGQLIYKTSATPCSCWCCSGEYKYKRHLKKREDYKLIREAIELQYIYCGNNIHNDI